MVCGYKLEVDDNNNRINIIDMEMSIDMDEIDSKVKADVLNYYDFKNKYNRDEKKKILVNIISELEPKREEIKRVLGNHTEKLYGLYANGFNTRHNNITKGKQYYHETIAELSDEEMCKWYDYIYSFMLNIYHNISKLTDVRINNNFIKKNE